LSVRDLAWKELYHHEGNVSLAADSVQQVTTVPLSLYRGGQRLLFINLALHDQQGREVSHNVYWVPTTLTTFDWAGSNFTHTPADRYEDLQALAHLPPVQLESHATRIADKRITEVTLHNPSSALAFQVHVAARTASGDLVAPVLWSDNWVEIAPGATTILSGALPPNPPADLAIEVEGWNVAHNTLRAAE
ncbi:MAG: hypothetical protein ACRYF4_03940, partial [Janthinobacterium lividum]